MFPRRLPAVQFRVYIVVMLLAQKYRVLALYLVLNNKRIYYFALSSLLSLLSGPLPVPRLDSDSRVYSWIFAWACCSSGSDWVSSANTSAFSLAVDFVYILYCILIVYTRNIILHSYIHFLIINQFQINNRLVINNTDRLEINHVDRLDETGFGEGASLHEPPRRFGKFGEDGKTRNRIPPLSPPLENRVDYDRLL